MRTQAIDDAELVAFLDDWDAVRLTWHVVCFWVVRVRCGSQAPQRGVDVEGDTSHNLLSPHVCFLGPWIGSSGVSHTLPASALAVAHF